MFHRGLFPPPRHILRIRLGSDQRAHALISTMTYQRFQPQSNGLRVGGGAASRPGLSEKLLIDMQCLLHMYNNAILVWQKSRALRKRCARRAPGTPKMLIIGQIDASQQLGQKNDLAGVL